MDAHEIRRRFVEFFRDRGHTHVSSSSLVPDNDPTLLFTNAGMVQFKDVFTGRDRREYRRAVSVQRCLRAGGKHNDLENVGFTPRHHTLFEMLGNFSFGDYFKRDAIGWGWELLTEGLGLPADKLCVSVYSGEGEAAPADDEAAELWAAIVPRDRIYRFDAKENFWAMGDTGPCGPCTEIHIYRGDGPAPGHAGLPGRGPAFEDGAYMELWNLVFMQYERDAGGELKALPAPSVDTGAGLERLAGVIGGFPTNYETSLLRPMVAAAKRLAGRPDGPIGDMAQEAPFRVIADHARATAFLIADGVFPDRAGRSYVLRRIMRRAVRYGTEIGLDEPFFHQITREVVDQFGEVYPELRERRATIEEVVRGEEEAFRRTLDRGLRRLRVAVSELTQAGATTIAPELAAELYDTYGFPLDLTALIGREQGLGLDEPAAEAELRRRQASGAHAELGAGAAVADVWFEVQRKLAADGAGETRFEGYTALTGESPVLALVRAGQQVAVAERGEEVDVVVASTPFYAESGGQVGDTGVFTTAGGARLAVTDTVKPLAGLVAHRARVVDGAVRVGDVARLEVDAARRAAIRRNHSATHLLHYALREVLGEHVTQKGSQVGPDKLRFDFSHNRALTPEQRGQVERLVNEHVLTNAPSRVRELPLDEAKRAGAMMLFGEKYGERVRVVDIGPSSVELCGGTHVAAAGDIGAFSIVSEGSVAQGVRRIEAVTGMGAVAWLQQLQGVTADVQGLLHVGDVAAVPARVERLMADLRERERQIAGLQQRLATGEGGAGDEPVDVAGVKLLARRVGVADSKTLRAAADTLRDKLRSGVVVLGAEDDGKATLLVAATKDLADRVHAGQLVARLAPHVGGKGGGRPDLAQAGGKDPSGLDRAIAEAAAALAEQLQR
jgi:alanyl-tRNA synthetase